MCLYRHATCIRQVRPRTAPLTLLTCQVAGLNCLMRTDSLSIAYEGPKCPRLGVTMCCGPQMSADIINALIRRWQPERCWQHHFKKTSLPASVGQQPGQPATVTRTLKIHKKAPHRQVLEQCYRWPRHKTCSRERQERKYSDNLDLGSSLGAITNLRGVFTLCDIAIHGDVLQPWHTQHKTPCGTLAWLET